MLPLDLTFLLSHLWSLSTKWCFYFKVHLKFPKSFFLIMSTKWSLHCLPFKRLAPVCTFLEALYIDCSPAQFLVTMCHSPPLPKGLLFKYLIRMGALTLIFVSYTTLAGFLAHNIETLSFCWTVFLKFIFKFICSKICFWSVHFCEFWHV